MELVGAYRVVRRLASTNAGEVLLAKTDGPLGSERSVVLKVYAVAHEAGEEAQRTFAREATAYSRVNHPSIVRLLDFFALPPNLPDGSASPRAGQLCLALEHVDGPSLVRLRTLLKSSARELDDRVAIHLGASIFDALSVAHTAEDAEGGPAPLVHRDVNPSNVLMSWDAQVKLTDFGLARFSGPNHASPAGVAKGAYGYLAPEQVRGEELSPRADVYSAGIILWELLTKRRAFQRGALPEEEALRAMAEPRLATLESIRGDLHPNVVEVVRRALEPRVDQRTLTAEEAATLLVATISPEEAREQLVQALASVRAQAEATGSLPPRPLERKIVSSLPPPATKRGVAPPAAPDTDVATAPTENLAPIVIQNPPALDDVDYESRPSIPTPRRSIVDAGPVKGKSATARLAFAIPEPTPTPLPTLGTSTVKMTPAVPAPPFPQTLAPSPLAVTAPAVPPTPVPPPPVGRRDEESQQITQPFTRTLPLEPPLPERRPSTPPLRSSPPLALPSVRPPPPRASRWPEPARRIASSPVPPAIPYGDGGGVDAAAGRKPNRALPVLVTLAIGALVVALVYRAQPARPKDGPESTTIASMASSLATEAPSASATPEPAPLSTGAALPATATASSTPAPPASDLAPPAVPTQVASAPSESAAVPADMGRIRTSDATPGRRIFVDDKTVGQTPNVIVVRCGKHTVRLGSAGKSQVVDVPCRGEVSISGR